MNHLDRSSELKLIYEKLTRLIRWLVIGFIASTMWFLPYPRLPLLILLIVACFFNALQHIPAIGHSSVLSRKWIVVVANFILLSSLVILTGGLSSPYISLLFLIIIAGSYWYGYRGLLLTLASMLVLYGGLSLVEHQYTFNAVGRLMAMFLLGLYMARLNDMDEVDRAKLLRVDARLNIERAKLIALVNSLGEAIFAIDKMGNVILYNSAALELLDTHYDVIGKPFSDIVHLVDAKGNEVFPAATVLETGNLIIRDDLVLKHDNISPSVYIHITPTYEQATQTGAMILIRDISRQKSFENQKDEFISIISHELRTPVAIVEANVSTTLLPNFVELPDKARKMLGDAQRNLRYLSNLLRDLSDLARSERAILDTEIMPFKPAELLSELVGNFTDDVTKAGHTIKADIEKNIGTVTTSRARVEEILINYITNAIKYSGRPAQIVVGASKATKTPDGVCFWVADTGLGFSKSDAKNVFKKLFRSANKHTQSVKGTGMGLYIVKKQAESIGGKVWAKSIPSKGSVFYLEIPAQLPKDNKISATL